MKSHKPLMFDVGANVGSFSLLYSDKYSVVAIEANPILADKLKQRTEFVTESCAIGSACGVVPLHLCCEDQMSSCNKAWLTEMRYKDKGIQETINVPCVTLDTLIDKHGIPHHIKIDTEGYEYEVLMGLTHKVQSVQFEYIYEEFVRLTQPAIRRLVELGYTKFVIKNLCGDFTPEEFREYEDSTKYLTTDQILKMDGTGLCGGMILAF